MRPEKLSRPIEAPPVPQRAPALMHPALWDLRKRMLDWRARLAVELLVLLATLAVLRWSEAPAWAVVLTIYVATRSARVDAAADHGALHDELRAAREDAGKL